jgi:hypothetical protein
MADHGIGRVHHLEDEQAGQAKQRIPERRRHHAVGEILSRRLDRSSGHTCLVEHRHVPPDDKGDRRPTGRQAVAEPGRHRPDVLDQALLGEQDRNHKRFDGESHREETESGRERRPDRSGRPDKKDRRGNAPQPPSRKGQGRVVQPSVQRVDALPDKRDGVRQPSPQPGRVADQTVEQQGRGQEQQSEGEGSHRTAYLDSRTAITP